jgi:hypothetical protein
VEGILKITDTAVEDLQTLRNDFVTLINDLPAKIKAQITPAIEPIIKEFDAFVKTQYEPWMSTIKTTMGALIIEDDRIHSSMDDVVRRLLYPGDYLGEIDKMDPAIRDRQQQKIAEIASRGFREDAGEWNTEMDAAGAKLAALARALGVELPTVAWYVSELRTPQRPAGVKAEPRETWYVGDY